MERHPIPTVEEIVQEMSGACHFSKPDLCSGHHKLEPDAASQEIITFSITFGLHRHKRLTLGGMLLIIISKLLKEKFFMSYRLVIKENTPMCGCRMPKQHFIAMVCDCKLHSMILWCVMSVKLNVAKEIAGLEIMTLKYEKI